jgi:hypothetical protein
LFEYAKLLLLSTLFLFMEKNKHTILLVAILVISIITLLFVLWQSQKQLATSNGVSSTLLAARNADVRQNVFGTCTRETASGKELSTAVDCRAINSRISEGWDCSESLEKNNCSDNIDNDCDGLADNLDPDCAVSCPCFLSGDIDEQEQTTGLTGALKILERPQITADKSVQCFPAGASWNFATVFNHDTVDNFCLKAPGSPIFGLSDDEARACEQLILNECG